MKRMKFRFPLLFLLMCCAFVIRAQDNMTTRASFIHDFTKGKYIEWPEGKKEFKVIIIRDTALFTEVSKLTGKKGLFKKSRIKVSLALGLPDASAIDMGLIYMHSDWSDRKMASIIDLYKGKPILVVGENYPFHESMINFATIDGKLTFEMNKGLLEAQGLKALPELSALAASSEVQWNKLLVEAEAKALKEKEALQKQNQINQYHANKQINELSTELDVKDSALSSTSETLTMTRDELDARTKELVDKEAVLIRSKESLARQKQFTIFLIIGIGLAVVLIFFVYRNYVINKRAKNQLSEINKDLKRNKDELFYQKQLVDEKQKEITDSINYALRIQQSMLPPRDTFQRLIPDHFIFYKPKDIVSGDFYWIEQVGDLILFGVIDCTGHGVPGALMSVVGMNVLNQVVKERGITDPAVILNELDKGVYQSLRQYADDAAKDGMDLAICCWNSKTGELSFSGAFNPCWIVTSTGNGQEPVLNEIKGNMKSIGITFGSVHQGFTSTRVKINKGDCIYLFSDGFPDQFGGPHGKKFKSSRFRELFTGMNGLAMQQQREYVQQTFEDWKKEYDQIDDVCVMGVRL